MKRLLACVCPALVLSAACAPAGSLARSTPGTPGRHAYVRPQTVSPIGRWDNVMVLPVDAAVWVLTTDGRQTAGQFVSATSETLRLRAEAGEIELAAVDVMRVDQLPRPAWRELAEQGGLGAARGLVVIGLLGMAVGAMPPPRLFAAGALGGAAPAMEVALMAREVVTIYVAGGGHGEVRHQTASRNRRPVERRRADSARPDQGRRVVGGVRLW